LTLRTDKQAINQTIYVYWTLLYEKENIEDFQELICIGFLLLDAYFFLVSLNTKQQRSKDRKVCCFVVRMNVSSFYS
jgi:hypothetical protein